MEYIDINLTEHVIYLLARIYKIMIKEVFKDISKWGNILRL